MVTTLNFKDIIDLPKWRPLAPSSSTGSGIAVMACDFRNNEDRHPLIYETANSLMAYNVKNDGWFFNLPAFGTTSSGFFMSAQGPRGTIAAGATATSIPLTTALPASVGPNQLANRGDGRGFKVRIIGNSAGSSGKIEERIIIANTGPSTTPTLTLDSPLSFSPILGDAYEFLSGRIFILGATNAAGQFNYYDVLTNFKSSPNLSTANLPASWNSSSMVGLDELLVPYDRSPGEGFFGILTATATALGSLTGQAVGGDADVLANEHRNFQIRIVQDIAIPTAVGQRRNIASHTVGPSPVYTLSTNWAVTPSATATYVIENNGDRIIAWVDGSSQTSTYTISTNTWDANVTFAVRPLALTGTNQFGTQQAFSIEPDAAKNARHSFIFQFLGASTGTVDLFDIAGAATGTWTSNIAYGNKGDIFTNLCSTQNPATMEGRYMYITGPIQTAAPQKFYRFDMRNRVLEQMTILKIFVAQSASRYNFLGYTVFIDGNTKLSYIFYSQLQVGSINVNLFGLPITR